MFGSRKRIKELESKLSLSRQEVHRLGKQLDDKDALILKLRNELSDSANSRADMLKTLCAHEQSSKRKGHMLQILIDAINEGGVKLSEEAWAVVDSHNIFQERIEQRYRINW